MSNVNWFMCSSHYAFLQCHCSPYQIRVNNFSLNVAHVTPAYSLTTLFIFFFCRQTLSLKMLDTLDHVVGPSVQYHPDVTSNHTCQQILLLPWCPAIENIGKNAPNRPDTGNASTGRNYGKVITTCTLLTSVPCIITYLAPTSVVLIWYYTFYIFLTSL